MKSKRCDLALTDPEYALAILMIDELSGMPRPVLNQLLDCVAKRVNQRADTLAGLFGSLSIKLKAGAPLR